MADNCSGIEAWTYRSGFTDSSSWIADAFVRDNEALTKALQISLSDDSSASETLSSSAYLPPVPFTAADAESLGPPPMNLGARSSNTFACSPSGKISKRKSRASKRSPTTYINADPANFRRMVQEVTGVRLREDAHPVDPAVRPEAQRSGMGRGVQAPGFMPTLDTSAILLDRTCGSFGPVLDGPVFDFEPFPSFPTLESWGM